MGNSTYQKGQAPLWWFWPMQRHALLFCLDL